MNLDASRNEDFGGTNRSNLDRLRLRLIDHDRR
jgi:hypothetical protein